MREKYPKITKDNFNEIVAKLVKKGQGYDEETLNIQAPTNDKDFRKATKNLYGVALSVECLAYPIGSFSSYKYSCQYRIKGDQDKYSQGEIYQLWEKKFGEYDGLKLLLNTTFGLLFCGGVGGSHYGQTKCDKKTWLRVKNWSNVSNDLKIAIAEQEQRQSLRDIFGEDFNL